MAEVKVKLTGTNAVLAVLVLMGVGGFKWMKNTVPLTGGPESAIKDWIANRYSGELAETLSEEMEKDPEDVDADKLLAAANREIAASKVDIVESHMRKSGSGYIVHVKFTLDGELPSDGKDARYLRVSKGSGGGWFVDSETSSSSYYLALF